MAHYPQALRAAEHDAKHIVILAGSERGFCGDFNDSLVNAVSTDVDGVIAIGSRLGSKLEGNHGPVLAALAGANVAEEVLPVINRLLDTLNRLPSSTHLQNLNLSHIRLSVCYHETSRSEISRRQLLPPFLSNPGKPKYPNAPI
ncbi:MAG: hypothetical protein ABL925_11750, partial [Methylococcales bacterium]